MKTWTTPVVEEISFTQTKEGGKDFTFIDKYVRDDHNKLIGHYAASSCR